jgi:hypothetical protein
MPAVDDQEERPLYTARAWRRTHPDGSYLVSVGGVHDDGVPWDGEPTDEHVRAWLAGVLSVSPDSFDLQLSFDPGDVPPEPLRPD